MENIGPVAITMKNPSHEAIFFCPGYENITEVIEWLGNDFWAITCGAPVKIGDQTIKHVNAENPVPGVEMTLLIIMDPVSNRLICCSVNNWIVRDPHLGYVVMDASAFFDRYKVVESNPEVKQQPVD